MHAVSVLRRLAGALLMLVIVGVASLVVIGWLPDLEKPVEGMNPLLALSFVLLVAWFATTALYGVALLQDDGSTLRTGRRALAAECLFVASFLWYVDSLGRGPFDPSRLPFEYLVLLVAPPAVLFFDFLFPKEERRSKQKVVA